jgi:hypothetical protein
MTEGNPFGMNDLLDTFGLLAAAMLDDPLLALANAVAWLDPLWGTSDDDVYDEGDGVGLALCITRSAFPDIYAGAVERIRSGAAEKELDSFICGAISQRGIPLDNLEFLGYGIPLNACGIELSDPDLYAARPDLLPLVELFGIRPEPGHYNVEVPDCAYTAGRIIADNLVQQTDAGLKQVGWALAWLFSCSGNTLILCGIDGAKSSNRSTSREIRIPEQAYTAGRILAEDLATHTDARYRQVSWLLKWLFSCSGNSCVDWDDEMMSSMEPLSWSPEDIAFAIEMIQEADGIMADALAGSRWLLSEPALLLALWQNVRFLYKQLKKYPRREPCLHLEWPDPDDLPTLSPPLCPLTGQECQWVKSG